MNKSIICAALTSLAFCAGCSQQTINSAEKDTIHNIAVVDQKAAKAQKELKPKLSELDEGARVTAAISANNNLPTTIRVDANLKGVRLVGKVHTAAQKALAGQVARQTVKPGRTVSNALVVSP